MLCRVPVTFNTEVVHRGHRKSKSASMVEWTEVEIKETAGVDAPVACEWQQRPDRYGRGTTERRSTRWHEGSHWTEVWERNGDGDRVAPLSAERLVEMLASGRTLGTPLGVGVSWMHEELAAGTRAEFDPSAYRSVVSSEREATLAKAARQAEDLLVIDGMIWRRSREPVYLIKRDSITREEGRDPVLFPKVVPLPEDSFSDGDVFRADRFEDMAEEARARFGEFLSVNPEGKIAVHLPDSICHDDEWAAFLSAAQKEVERSRRGLGNAALGHVRSWVELAEAVEAASACRSQEAEAWLEQAAEARVASLGDSDQYFSEQLAKSIERWRVRPLSEFSGEGFKP